MTLVKTDKVRPLSIVLLGFEYWQRLIDWIRKTMLSNGCIEERELHFLVLLMMLNQRQKLFYNTREICRLKR
ncbi:MAG: putative Rossmann-fold nucleotide-binding protein [Porticoccus sp.]